MNLSFAVRAAVSLLITLAAGFSILFSVGGIFQRTHPVNAAVAEQETSRTVTVSPRSGARGTEITVSGEGFHGETTATIWLDADASGYLRAPEAVLAIAPIDSDGTFSATFTIDGSPFRRGSKNVINAMDRRKQPADTTANFTLLSRVLVAPDSAYVGDAIVITLDDFPANKLVQPDAVTLGEVRVPLTYSGTSGVVLMTDEQGHLVIYTRVPAATPPGSQALEVNFAGSGELTVNIDVLVPTLNVSPNQVVANQTMVLRGANFSPKTKSGGGGPHGVHQITGQGDSIITLDGVPLRSSVPYPIDLDSDGRLYAQITIPLVATTVSPGGLTLTATDDRGRKGVATVTIKQRIIEVDPPVSLRGSQITITGDGFPANRPDSTIYMPVDIKYNETMAATVFPNSTGSFRANIEVPLRTPPSTSNRVNAEVKDFSWNATSSHMVPPMSITVSPAAGPPGAVVTVSGVSFESYTSLADFTISGLGIMPSPVPTTDVGGVFTTSLLIPQLNIDHYTITVTIRGLSVSTDFEVTERLVQPEPEPVPIATPEPTPVPSVEISPVEAFEPLNANLVRVWHFLGPERLWTFYDTMPDSNIVATLTEIVPDEVYWIEMRKEQIATLNGKERNLYLGWNLLHW